MVASSAINRDAASAYIILARENQQTADLFIDNNKHKSAAFCIEQCVEQSLIAFAFCLDEAVGKRAERRGTLLRSMAFSRDISAIALCVYRYFRRNSSMK